MQGNALFARLQEALESPSQGVTAQVRSLSFSPQGQHKMVFPPS